MITFPSLPDSLFFLQYHHVSLSTLHISLRTINGAHMKKGGFDFFLPFFTRLPSRALFDRGRHRMVIRGHIKNGNGTNKYRIAGHGKRLSNLFEYHIRFTVEEKERKLFIPSLFFSKLSPVRQSTPKKCSRPPLSAQKSFTLSEWKKRRKIYVFLDFFQRGNTERKIWFQTTQQLFIVSQSRLKAEGSPPPTVSTFFW